MQVDWRPEQAEAGAQTDEKGRETLYSGKPHSKPVAVCDGFGALSWHASIAITVQRRS